MKSSTSIDQQCLIEAIVEIRFLPNPDLDRALWPGMLMPKLADTGYKFQNVPQLGMVQQSDGAIKLTIDQDTAMTSLFTNETTGVRLLISNSTISFNCSKENPLGWEEYFHAIESVLDIFEAENIVYSYDRTMIRYIREFEFNILEKVDVDVNSHSDTRYNTLEISLARQENNINAYVSISGLRERMLSSSDEKRITSLFDVNVFDKLNENSNIDIVKESLCNIFNIEEESFFGMLKDDYAETLNTK